MSENSSFKSGQGSQGVQNKPTKEDGNPKDEYRGGYKERHDQYGEDALFGTDQLPVTNSPMAGKGLKSVGG